MADRPEWISKGADDLHRDLEAIKDTGLSLFNLSRIFVEPDSDIHDTATKGSCQPRRA